MGRVLCTQKSEGSSEGAVLLTATFTCWFPLALPYSERMDHLVSLPVIQ